MMQVILRIFHAPNILQLQFFFNVFPFTLESEALGIKKENAACT